jgi:hypothetical protein
MQAARALQDAFGLRSTVAVLGFSLRTLADQLAKGQLDALVAEHRAQAGSRPPAPRRGGADDAPRHEGRGGRGGARIDPFARPSRPAPPVDASPADPGVAEPQAEAEAGEEPVAAADKHAEIDAGEAAESDAAKPAQSDAAERDVTPSPEA